MISRARRIRSSVAGAVAVAAAALIAGCASGTPSIPASDTPAPATTTAASALGAGFWDPSHPPAPEGTLDPVDGSWADVHPPAGYSVVLVTFGDDAPTTTLVSAIRSWATDEHVALETVTATSASTLLDAVTAAIDKKPDLIISAGEQLVDPLAALTPVVLAQQFLVVGAELAEPTVNVTAADWTGAGFRGEGLGNASHYDPASFTDERAGRALRAGIAAVVSGITGIVVWVD
ncbi:hypothetical protein QT381_04445 [Galbitalea sp. SE-J8]|uniref:hypothetical protein n=1 Tax=Galbitalea sp. SE-J8 TaxID=3054952 RepID=UPI00259C742F|nr:hypothetical protein [Galbitalea sp. SE-J8]MDM4762254.1 hypothetical protein [Galbitalea sp. SE-J8]